MNFELAEEQLMLRAMARRFAEEEMLPTLKEYERQRKVNYDVIKKMGELGLIGPHLPQEYGGAGLDYTSAAIIWEQLSWASWTQALVSMGHGVLAGTIIMSAATEEQKQKYLPDIASGKRLAAFALTEPTAGSDASAIKTTAERVKGGYVINGTKQFITNGGEAEIYTVIALTDKARGARGASAFLVEKDTPGFSFGKKEKKMGIRASSTRELVFRNCLVPEENLIGKEGMGFIVTLKLLDRSRPGIGAQAVGLAQGALEAAVDYARKRIQFGHPIISLPVVQNMLADMAINVEASRALTYAVARTIDSGAKNFTEEAAMAKVFASDIAMKVTTDAVQIFGGVGYMRDYPIEKMMRDAKITQIYEGSNEVLRSTIAFELRKRKARRE